MSKVLSVYLGEDRIQTALIGRGRASKVSGCHTYKLSKGTLINDVVVDSERVKEALTAIADDYRPHNRNVHLVLGGGQSLAKVIQVPPLTKRQLLNLTKREIEAFNASEKDLVYDYSVVKRRNRDNKGGTILCAAMERCRIEEFVTMFRECGLKVRALNLAMNVLVGMGERLAERDRSTCILSVLDGRNLRSVLYVDGVFHFASRQRLLSEPGTEEIIEELMKAVTAIVRFNEAQKTGFDIDRMYFGGLTLYEAKRMFPALRDLSGADVGIFRTDEWFGTKRFRFCDYIYPVGNLLER